MFKIVLLFVLGSHISFLHDSRIESAINYYNNNCDQNNTNCYIIGIGKGYKMHNDLNSPEAEKFNDSMHSLNITQDKLITERSSRNSAENAFCINEISNLFIEPEIIVFTNHFHEYRMFQFLKYYIPNKNFKIVSNKISCSYCYQDEITHSSNIIKDITEMPLKSCLI